MAVSPGCASAYASELCKRLKKLNVFRHTSIEKGPGGRTEDLCASDRSSTTP
jgi:protein gp37